MSKKYTVTVFNTIALQYEEIKVTRRYLTNSAAVNGESVKTMINTAQTKLRSAHF